MQKKTSEDTAHNGWVDIAPEVINGFYSNLMAMAHSRSEFILDFFTMLPGMQSPHLRQRIILSPVQAKLFYLQLMTEVERFESANGEITIQSSQEMTDDGSQEIKA